MEWYEVRGTYCIYWTSKEAEVDFYPAASTCRSRPCRSCGPGPGPGPGPVEQLFWSVVQNLSLRLRLRLRLRLI